MNGENRSMLYRREKTAEAPNSKKEKELQRSASFPPLLPHQVLQCVCAEWKERERKNQRGRGDQGPFPFQKEEEREKEKK
jgi:hypothetical protein